MFKKTLLATVLISTSLAMANTNNVVSNDDNREALSITIYNESLALINETRNIPFKAGLNNVELKGVSAQIRAETALLTSLSKMPFNVIEQNFDYDLLSPHALLEKAVGQEIEIIRTNPATGIETRETATLLSNNGAPVLQFKDRIEIGAFDKFAFKSIPEGLRDRPTLSVLLNSDKDADNKVQLTYLTRGFSWKADYTATLSDDEKHLDLSGLITLNNQSGTTFNNAKLQLVAGDVNQVSQPSPVMMEARMMKSAVAYDMVGGATEEQFGDYHLYKIPFATNLKNNQTKQVALLSTQNVLVQKEYNFNQYYGYTTQDGQNLKASVLYRLENSKENQLGMPLPKGVFRMYKNDSSGNALLLGEDTINHTAENEEFVINTGDAFDVSMIKILKDHKAISKNVTQYTYEVVFNNAKDEAVDVNYTSFIGDDSNWQLLKTSQPMLKGQSSDIAKWTVKVPAKEKVTLTYTLQVSSKY